MSNPPPVPPLSYPSGYSPPGGGYGGGGGGGGGYEPQRTNGFAIAGLVASLFVCCLGIHVLIGLVLSGVGLATSRKTNSGKGMSIAGIVISLIMLLVEVAGGYGIYVVAKPVYAAMQESRAVVMAIRDGDTDKVQRLTAGTVSASDVLTIRNAVQDAGKFESVQISPTGISEEDTPDGKRISLSGKMLFANKIVPIRVVIMKMKDGRYLIRGMKLDTVDVATQPSTQPSSQP